MAGIYDPWENISDESRGLFGELSGADYFESDFEEQTAKDLYATGFGFTEDQYESAGLTMDDVYAAREAFFDFMQMDEDSFPWDEWREVMGYE